MWLFIFVYHRYEISENEWGGYSWRQYRNPEVEKGFIHLLFSSIYSVNMQE